MKKLKKEFILLALSGILLISILVYMTFAWYTKMTSVGGIRFDVARWDFTADYSVDAFSINVFDYSSLNEKKAAPGTAGIIELSLSTAASDTDAVYSISVLTDSMSDRFRERIHFYYLNSSGNKVYLDDGNDHKLQGSIERGTTNKNVQVYWEWLYDLDEVIEWVTNNPSAGVSVIETSGSLSDPTDAQRKEFDAFDTDVGIHPELYVQEMSALIRVVGAEARPVLE